MTRRKASGGRTSADSAGAEQAGTYTRVSVGMDTFIRLRVDSDCPAGDVEAGFERALRWFAAVEAASNRFDATSELRRLCTQTGRAVAVSPMLLEAVSFALAVAKATGGAFDPTLGTRLQQRGFARSYLTGQGEPEPVLEGAGADYRDVQVDQRAGTITLRWPLLLDLGAVAKGLALDLAARELSGFARYGVEAGGDLRVGGTPPPWQIGIRRPDHAEALLGTLMLQDGAVCTSGGYERPAAEAGEHHVIDPRSSRSPRGLTSVSVAAPTAIAADALATAALVLGPVDGLRLLEREGVDGLAVSEAGELLATPAFAERLQWEPLRECSPGSMA